MMPFGNYRLTVTLYDCNWKKLPYSHSYDICIFTLKKPKNLELMLKYARIFSKDFKLLSTDFYEIDGQLYFSGFNFSPSSGFMTYYPENIDEMLGDRLTV